ncbi:BTB/POZ domain-containing protein 18 [Manis pentadactyla]|uniref:BTB/POZ domain-containing protein 18 n=1 Tax=Manis pentadactyla TaxID=143292 RepID=UPI0018770E0C|nr:BTB/POZ domain-containing protein 18 [Manis pentadactyla]
MCSPASPKIVYRNPQFLRLAFLQLHHQQQSGVFCDVLLKAEGEAIPAHCCILSACSPFFTERLKREWPAPGQKVVLDLEGLKIKTLRKLVDFLYTSEMEVSQEEAQDVLSAARQLHVSELESLQLEGGKLVKPPQGRKLNRKCFQPPGAAPITARVVASSHCHCTPLPVTQIPCPPGAVRLKSSGKEEGPQEKSNRQNAENWSGTLLLKRKARVCGTQEKNSPSSHSQGPEENKSDPALGPTALSLPSLYPSVDERLLPRKIRLSRSKPSPDVCTSKPSSILSGPSSAPAAPGRRLWRQKSVNKEAPEDKQKRQRVSPLQSTPGPCGLGKIGGSKKQSSQVRAPNSDSAEEGHVGKVKLRKIVNGTCWEVVQEPPLKSPQDSPQIPEPRDLEEPPGTRPSSAKGRETPSASIDLCPDSSVCSRLRDILSASRSPDHPVVKSEVGSSPELAGKEPGVAVDGGEPYASDTALLGQPCEAEEYRITSAAATSELEEILDFMLCGSDTQPPLGSLESPGAEDCMTPPAYHLTDTGKNWIEGEEWCLPDMELCPRELTKLEKEPVSENRESDESFSTLVMPTENEEPIKSLSPLVMPSEMSEGEVLSMESSWTRDLEITCSQPSQKDTLLHAHSLDTPQRSSEDLLPTCSNWAETEPEESLTMDEILYPGPEAGREVFSNSEWLGPLPANSDEEIDVVDWTSQGRLVPTSIPSVWPDPSSESETEVVDILM